MHLQLTQNRETEKGMICNNNKGRNDYKNKIREVMNYPFPSCSFASV